MSDATPTPITKRALGRVFAILNRADELGGEVRDFVQEKVLRDERYIAMRTRLAALRGKAYVSKVEGEKKVAVAQAQAAAVAAPVVAPIAKGDKALGDAGIKAQVYGRKSCAWTGRAITILEKNKIDHDFVDMDEPEFDAMQLRLVNETKQHTVPYIYLRGHFIGGYNALAEVERLGQLEVALMTAEERAAAPAHLRNVVITARPNTDEIVPVDAIVPE
jgi:glutaredoxin